MVFFAREGDGYGGLTSRTAVPDRPYSVKSTSPKASAAIRPSIRASALARIFCPEKMADSVPYEKGNAAGHGLDEPMAQRRASS
jgi:hypothetical protein